jgi:hypothetical protein
MDELREKFTAGRQEMLASIADLTRLAALHGAPPEEITRANAAALDGNVKVKEAWRVAVILLGIRGWDG